MNIWIAAADNNRKQVEKFLNSGVDVNAKDENGYTPLHAAAEYAHLDLIEFLLEKGAEINIKDNDGDSPLHACESAEAAAFLVERDADLEAKNNDGLTPLQKAEEDGELVELIQFYKSKSSQPESADLVPENIKLSMQEADAIPLAVSDEQRQQLKTIIESGSVDAFQDYIQSAFSNQSTDSGSNEPKKKR